MTRRAHFVGSLPPELQTGDREVLQWFLDKTAGHPITALPRDLHPDWFLPFLQNLKNNPDVLVVDRPGGYAHYGDYPTFRVREGCTLEPKHVSLNRIERLNEAISVFHSLQQENSALADTKLLLSRPSPLDMSMFIFAASAVANDLPLGPALSHPKAIVTGLRNVPIFTRAAIEEMREISAQHGESVVWQIESPLAMLSQVKAAQLWATPLMARLVARQLADLLKRMHAVGASAILHLCYGDYLHTSLLAPQSLAPAVTLLHHTRRLLHKTGTPLPPVHIPCAHGGEPAPLNPSFYQALRRLDSEWEVIAGVVSEDLAGSAHALQLFEEALDHPVYGVASACGLGRCTVEVANQVAANTVTVAKGETTIPTEPN